ncbi:hypothetical protein DFH06DRAFT_159863 [Mycena polygramma]|nr:hypothetical protein DFH06DRAFT_159863 [Mycena polygramma]
MAYNFPAIGHTSLMRLSLPFRGRKPAFPTGKLKSIASRSSNAIPDILETSLISLRDSADACAPLKSAVSAAIALWKIAQRAKDSQKEACEIALRTEKIVNLIADAVPDIEAITPQMMLSIERFTVLLDDIHHTMAAMEGTGRISRVIHLNRNERTLRDIRAQLDAAYQDFSLASALRVEAQQAYIWTLQRHIEVQQQDFAVQQTVALGKVSDTLALQHSTIIFYSRLGTVFLACPCVNVANNRLATL